MYGGDMMWRACWHGATWPGWQQLESNQTCRPALQFMENTKDRELENPLNTIVKNNQTNLECGAFYKITGLIYLNADTPKHKEGILVF